MATIELEKIGSDFIKENDKVPKQDIRKGGPYTKAQRTKRRNEVYRLHFEYGYSALKIAETMKMNRHTIAADITYWYGALASEWEKIDIHGWCMKQLHSLETQKNILLTELKKAKRVQERVSIERLILEVDDRITKLIMQVNKSDDKIRQSSLALLNRWADKNGLEHRFIDQLSLLKITESQFDKIQQVLGNES